MKTVIGLGNPGEKYTFTRHNVGVMFLGRLLGDRNEVWKQVRGIEVCELGNLRLVKSAIYFMNESGKIIDDLKFLDMAENILVVHDDLDLKLGEYKIQHGKGPELHGGINDIEMRLGKDFERVRIGVDGRSSENRLPGEVYVLERFAESELVSLQKIFDEIAEAINRG